MFSPSTINKQVSFGGVISSVRVIGYVIGGEYSNKNLISDSAVTSLKILFRPMILQKSRKRTEIRSQRLVFKQQRSFAHKWVSNN